MSEAPASEAEYLQFIIQLGDRPGDDSGSNDHTRLHVAAQLAGELALKKQTNLNDIKAIHKLVSSTAILHRILSQLIDSVRANPEKLTKADYKRYMGALWRQQPADEIRKAFDKDPAKLAEIYELRGLGEPFDRKPGLYEGLGLVDPARTRRSQHPSLRRTRQQPRRAKGTMKPERIDDDD